MSYQFSCKPYAHQLEIIKFMLNHRRGYNFSDLGTGKTKSSIWFCDILFEAEKIKQVLIVCPLSLMHSVWGTEIEATTPNRSYSVVHGTRTIRVEALARRAHYYIINIDALRNYERELMACKFDIVIVDECDSLKNQASQRSRAFQRMVKQDTIKGVYGLTGMPMANSPIDAFGIGKAINPTAMPTPYITKWKQMTMYQPAPFVWLPTEQAESIVHQALQPAIAFKLSECIDLPDITFEYRQFEMTKAQNDLYKEVHANQMAEYADGMIVASTAAIKSIKLQQITAGVVYDIEGNPIALPMNDRLEEVQHIQKEAGQVIVFVQFVEVLKHLHNLLPECELIYGATKPRERARILADFKAGKFKILLAQPRVLAHGVNLQFVSTIIFWGPICGNNYYRQAVGRVRRSGQTRKQVIINFYASQVEKKLYKSLETKDVSSQILLNLYYKS